MPDKHECICDKLTSTQRAQLGGHFLNCPQSEQSKSQPERRVEKLSAALDEIEGFARRNEERARKALDALKHSDPGDMVRSRAILQARHHEAARIYEVIKFKVAEAKHG